MKTLLVMRFSALGDVAMTIPVLCSLVKAHPQVRIVFVSRKAFRPLFATLPPQITFVGADFKGEHSGLSGLNQLYRQLRRYNIDAVADLHSVLRSWYLDMRFRLTGLPVARIEKGRKEKKALTRHKGPRRPVATTFERYRRVFGQLGLPFDFSFGTILQGDEPLSPQIAALLGERTPQERRVGIAPFARHRGKIYPTDKMEQVVKILSQKEGVRLFLFGNGKEEADILSRWEERYPRTLSMVGKSGGMAQELQLMSRLDVMLSMDSANMHFASLVGTPVVSVWGATSPDAGFLGWGQKPENCVQLAMECRPCSVYGNKPCRRGDYACLAIEPQTIADRLLAVADGR